MSDYFIDGSTENTIPITILDRDALSPWLMQQDAFTHNWVMQNGYKAEPGTICIVPDVQGKISRILFSKNSHRLWSYARLANSVPQGNYHLDETSRCLQSAYEYELALLGWALGQYQYAFYLTDYVAVGRKMLKLPPTVNKKQLDNLIVAHTLIRDLINTPAQDLHPQQLALAAQKLAKQHAAKVSIIEGEKLLKKGFRAIHAVGRAASCPPCLIDLRWGDKNNPAVTLIGKGVCFDTGGLDIKTAMGMRLMKKDMAGAAHVLGLAHLIMVENLPISLRVLIPAVENAVSGNSLHPGDIIRTRSGKTVEVHNTDAEGRLVLCDAIAEALMEKPDCLIDFSTLTGAAAVALGPEIPAYFTNNEQLGQNIRSASKEVDDLLWRMPLHAGYQFYLKSTVADISNASEIPMAGAITAALYLQYFVPHDVPWMHIDMKAWNEHAQPGRPIGGEVMALRAVYAYLQKCYGGIA